MTHRMFAHALGAMALCLATTASAATVSIGVDAFDSTQVGAARAAYDAHAAGMGMRVVEDFESFEAWNGTTQTRDPANTRVGSFQGAGRPGSGGAHVGDGTGSEIRTAMPYYARSNLTVGGQNWLDSNDLEYLVWDIAPDMPARFNSLAFFLTDVSDVPGTNFTFTLEAEGIDATTMHIAPQANGGINFVRILFDQAVANATLTFDTKHNDGFGLDEATIGGIAPVPLPPAALLLVAGLGGLGLIGRRRAGKATA